MTSARSLIRYEVMGSVVAAVYHDNVVLESADCRALYAAAVELLSLGYSLMGSISDSTRAVALDWRKGESPPPKLFASSVISDKAEPPAHLGRTAQFFIPLPGGNSGRRVILAHALYTTVGLAVAVLVGLGACYVLALNSAYPFIDSAPGWVGLAFRHYLPVALLASSVLGVLVGQVGFWGWLSQRRR